jgi:hypothetical protein
MTSYFWFAGASTREASSPAHAGLAPQELSSAGFDPARLIR